MRTLRRFFKRLSSWTTASEDEERLRAEIEGHLDMQTGENIRAGLSAGEARRQAILKFGGIEATREIYRDQRGLPFIETLIHDTRHALRRLRNTPAFTSAAILTLALGIGATTSIFTLVHAVLLKSLAVANPAELYRVGKESRCCFQGGFSQDKEFSLFSYDLYRYLRDNTKGFPELAAFPAYQPLFGVRREGSAEPAQSEPGEFVSGNYFDMFGIRAYAGRTLTASDDRPGAPPVAVMSYRLWHEGYGSNASVIGGVFHLNDKPFTVIGIAPPSFFGDTLRNRPPDFFLPLNTEPYIQSDADLNKADTHWLELIGRIKPGANPALHRIRDASRVEAMAAVALGRDGRECARELSQPNAVPSAGRRGNHEYAGAIRALAADPDDDFGVRVADRLRQCRQPSAGSRYGTAAAGIGKPGAGRASIAPCDGSTD